MRVSQLPHRLLPADVDGSSPGDRWLRRAGFVVELGPGLVAGTPLLQAVLDRLEGTLAAALEDAGARAVALPATESQALTNLALHLGPLADGATRALYAFGTGFRPDATSPRGLLDLQLYRRLDVVALSDAARGAPWDDVLLRALAAVELAGVTADEDELVLPLDGDGGRLALGGATRRPVEAGDGAEPLLLCAAHLDLFAVVAALAERHHDERGLAWPRAVAPFDVGIVPTTADTVGAADKLALDLERAGFATLLDDRDAEPAAKRRAAEQWGLPLRLVCGSGGVVAELRAGGAPERLAPDALIDFARRHLAADPPSRRRRLRRRAAY